jgi:hypothetical protein
MDMAKKTMLAVKNLQTGTLITESDIIAKNKSNGIQYETDEKAIKSAHTYLNFLGKNPNYEVLTVELKDETPPAPAPKVVEETKAPEPVSNEKEAASNDSNKDAVEAPAPVVKSKAPAPVAPKRGRRRRKS